MLDVDEGIVAASSHVSTNPNITTKFGPPTVGDYEVGFDRAVVACPAVATPKAHDGAFPSAPLLAATFTNQTQVAVYTYDTDGRSVANGFNLAVFC